MDRFEKTKLLGLDFDDTVTSNSTPIYRDLYTESLAVISVRLPKPEFRELVDPVWGDTGDSVMRYIISRLTTEGRTQEPAEEKIVEAVERYETDLRSGVFVDRAELVPGVIDTLQSLKNGGIQIGLATGNVPEVIDKILLKHGVVPEFFVDRVSAYSIRKADRQKPNPYSLSRLKRAAEAVRRSTILNREIVYVGDSGNDVRMAQALPGVEPVVVLTGNLTKQEAMALGVPKLNILNDLCEIETVLERRETV